LGRFGDEAAVAGYGGGPNEALSVLWLGSPLPWQDNLFLRKVAALAAQGDREIRFVVCSVMPDTVFADLPNATILTDLSYTDLTPVIKTCNVGIVYYPVYSWLRGMFYNSPIKLFDFMAAGLCVIASPFGQIARAICSGENGVLMKKNSPEECAGALAELAASPTRLAGLGREARADVAAYYNWDRVVDRVCDLLHKAVRGEDLSTTLEDDVRAEPVRPARRTDAGPAHVEARGVATP
jgi:glycosyltransferase involved in cell wall biosynthesis